MSVSSQNVYWGYDLIKHDFTSHDLFEDSLSAARHGVLLTGGNRKFHDKTHTTATIIKFVPEHPERRRVFNWSDVYDGSRCQIDWMQ